MKNVTISIEETVEKFAKIEASKQGKSLSRYIRDMIVEIMNKVENADGWIESFRNNKPYIELKTNPVKREEIYDRKVFR